MKPIFLTVDSVLAIHNESLRRYGGLEGIRSLDLLESAVAQPRAGFGGEFLHPDLFMMAAAYLFHLVKNHPFLDGNKRTGLACALSFLDENGAPIEIVTLKLYESTMAVAEGRLEKEELAALLQSLARPRENLD